MFTVVIYEYNRYSTERIFGKFESLKTARKKAYREISTNGMDIVYISIYDDARIIPYESRPKWQKKANIKWEEIAGISIGRTGDLYKGLITYTPNRNSKYYRKHPLKYNHYFLKADGSLGKGRW